MNIFSSVYSIVRYKNNQYGYFRNYYYYFTLYFPINFGVGLLIIGTPIFLQLGYDFLTVLNILLPFSVMISILQRMTSGSINHLFKANFVIITIPFVLSHFLSFIDT